MMELQHFVDLFGAQFDETPASEFSPETEFRELDEWSSLTALSVIAMVDDEFDIQLTGDEIRSARVIEDIYHIIKSKKQGA